MSNRTIVCDKCDFVGCTVSEILPKSEQISMKSFAKEARSPYRLDQYTYQERDREWKIECPECKHSLTYIERAERVHPMFGDIGS